MARVACIFQEHIAEPRASVVGPRCFKLCLTLPGTFATSEVFLFPSPLPSSPLLFSPLLSFFSLYTRDTGSRVPSSTLHRMHVTMPPEMSFSYHPHGGCRASGEARRDTAASPGHPTHPKATAHTEVSFPKAGTTGSVRVSEENRGEAPGECLVTFT